jgi:hypothetical protein
MLFRGFEFQLMTWSFENTSQITGLQKESMNLKLCFDVIYSLKNLDAPIKKSTLKIYFCINKK